MYAMPEKDRKHGVGLIFAEPLVYFRLASGQQKKHQQGSEQKHPAEQGGGMESRAFGGHRGFLI
jgi:hypothetical protein